MFGPKDNFLYELKFGPLAATSNIGFRLASHFHRDIEFSFVERLAPANPPTPGALPHVVVVHAIITYIVYIYTHQLIFSRDLLSTNLF